MSKNITTKEFINRAKKVHKDEYDYSKVEYKNSRIKVCIICPMHGEFWQEPRHHLSGCKCKRCASSKPRTRSGVSNTSTKGLEMFVEKARKIHGDKYNYSKVNYINSRTKICIICPIHGEFWQTPENHLSGKGCRKCGIENSINKHRKTNEQFISECKELYGDKYDYSNVVYVNKSTKISIICNKCGKEFLMTPHNHLVHKEECPYCKTSKLETSVENILMENSIEYEQQKVFDWLVDGKKIKRFDFYLPKYNVAIECQGLQHFKPIKWFGGEEHFTKQKHNDELKRKLCEEHNVKLIYYSDLDIEYPYEVITDKSKLIETIVNCR